jgi:hypothetical protein
MFLTLATQGITLERLIAMTEAELNIELGMGRHDIQRINTHLHPFHKQLEKKAHQDSDHPTASSAAMPSRSLASQQKAKKLTAKSHKRNTQYRELIAESDKWMQRSLRRDSLKLYAICDMIPSLII